MNLSCLSCCHAKEEKTVKEIDLSHSALHDVPSSIFLHERTLDTLYLNSNRLLDLPLPLFYCQNLQVLVLSDNNIHTLPAAIGSLTQLRSLDLSRNGLEGVHKSIKGCKKLMSLSLSMNPLRVVPEGVSQLIALEELYLNECELDFIPANIGRLVRLRLLELRDNKLSSLPKTLVRFVRLTRLDIGQNDFTYIPPVIGSLLSLQELWMDLNGMMKLSDIFKNLKNLTHIDMSDNTLECLPDSLCECESLVELTLSNNDLYSLNPRVGKLRNLITLKLDYNNLSELPNSIGELVNLEELYVSSNTLRQLPSSIGLLRRLICLGLDTNDLRALPPEIGSCSNLRVLTIQDNLLKSLPAEIGNLQNLSVLSLTKNYLRSLPMSVLNMRKLRALWLVVNQSKPLTALNRDFDPEIGGQVLTCYLLPQTQTQSQQTTASETTNYANKQKSTDRPRIRFSNPCVQERPSTFLRSPTPYPKKLKELEKCARAIASRTSHLAKPELPVLNVSEANLMGEQVRTAVVKKQFHQAVSSMSDSSRAGDPEQLTNGSLSPAHNGSPGLKAGQPPPYHIAAVFSKKAPLFHAEHQALRTERRTDIDREALTTLKDELLHHLPRHCSRVSLSEHSGSEGPTSPRRTMSDVDSAFVDTTPVDGTYSACPGIVVANLPIDNSYPIHKVNNWLTTKTKSPVDSDGCEYINMYPCEDNTSFQAGDGHFQDSGSSVAAVEKKPEDLITSSKITKPSKLPWLFGVHKYPTVLELTISKTGLPDLGFDLMLHESGVYVKDVSPQLASQGLQNNDKILQIDGVDVYEGTQPALQSILSDLLSFQHPFTLMISRQM